MVIMDNFELAFINHIKPGAEVSVKFMMHVESLYIDF